MNSSSSSSLICSPSPSSSSSCPSSSSVPPHLCQRGLKCSENHLENLTSVHTYLKLHEAKQNDVEERLIGSMLVSAQFVGSQQETRNTYGSKVCCLEFMLIYDLRTNLVRTSAVKVGVGVVEVFSSPQKLAAVQALKKRRDEKDEGAGLLSLNVLATGTVVNRTDSAHLRPLWGECEHTPKGDC